MQYNANLNNTVVDECTAWNICDSEWLKKTKKKTPNANIKVKDKWNLPVKNSSDYSHNFNWSLHRNKEDEIGRLKKQKNETWLF